VDIEETQHQKVNYSKEHTLPKTTPAARTAIRTGNESSSDHAGTIA
jgi:hypothetical protein